jgi:3-dehydroquinate dehydratase-2
LTTLWVLNGPNLNLLGTREPELYGRGTLAEVERALVEHGRARGVAVECFQANGEGELIDRVQQARTRAHGLIVNFGAYSHSSLALADAIAAVALPAIEVHVTNVHRREPFRRRLITAGACLGAISGLGTRGYHLALDALIDTLASSEVAR